MSNKASTPTAFKDVKNLNRFQQYFFEYGIYHNNKTNVLIHLIFVPIIGATLFAITRYISKEYFNCSKTLGFASHL